MLRPAKNKKITHQTAMNETEKLQRIMWDSTSRHKTSSSQKDLNLKTQKQYRVRTQCQLKSHIAKPMKIHHMPNTECTILLQILYIDQEPLLDYVTHQCEFMLMISQVNHSPFNPKIVLHIGNIQQNISQKPHRNCTEGHTRIQGQE
jgi:1-aminocyclopropane-1-carboxylate deaminase/D-cysteine desulfhydrase-like pyridoxal-dependent ACC family enzyme